MFLPTHSSEDRLQAWRKFRRSFPTDGDESLVVKEFASVKILSRYIDYYTPRDWPGVFDIVSNGYFCQTGLTLVMTATLHHLGFINTNNLQFMMVSNNITGCDGAVLVHDSKCYNFLPGEIVTKEYAIQHSVQFSSTIITADKLFG